MTENQKHFLPDFFVIILLVAFYMMLDVFLNARGMFFVATPLKNFWQVLDPEWLENDLWRSLLYLHAQPPFFNALIGWGLITFGKNFAQAFDQLYQVVAISIVILLYINQRLLNIPRVFASLLSLLWVAYPAFIYFQNFLFYPIWVQLFLLLALLFLLLAIRCDWRYLFVFFAAILLLFFTRSTFNQLYVVFCVLALLLARRWTAKQVFSSAAPALIVIALWMFKNLWLFGEVSTSSWLGMNLANVTLSGFSQSERAEWVRQGAIHPIGLFSPFNDIQDYPQSLWGERAADCNEAPALCEMYKTNGQPNYNFIGYLEISENFLQADLYVIRAEPQRVFAQVMRAWQLYFLPSVRTVFLNQRAFAPVASLADVSDRVLCGAIVQDVYTQPPCVTLQVGYWVAYFLAVLAYFFAKQRDLRFALLFCLLTLLYAVSTGTLLDLGENNRFRFETEPLWLVVVGYAFNLIKIGFQHEPTSQN